MCKRLRSIKPRKNSSGESHRNGAGGHGQQVYEIHSMQAPAHPGPRACTKMCVQKAAEVPNDVYCTRIQVSTTRGEQAHLVVYIGATHLWQPRVDHCQKHTGFAHRRGYGANVAVSTCPHHVSGLVVACWRAAISKKSFSSFVSGH